MGHVADIKACMDVLNEHLTWVQLAPTAMGSGRCSLNYKAHCIIHATRLVSHDWLDSALVQLGVHMVWRHGRGTGPPVLAWRHPQVHGAVHLREKHALGRAGL